jgi:hypothetical protein
MNPLKRFTNDQLIEELVRRRNGQRASGPQRWCHDCDNFQAWNEAPRQGPMPEDFNPCTKGHRMHFMVPEGFDDEHGFYRPICADRTPELGKPQEGEPA